MCVQGWLRRPGRRDLARLHRCGPGARTDERRHDLTVFHGVRGLTVCTRPASATAFPGVWTPGSSLPSWQLQQFWRNVLHGVPGGKHQRRRRLHLLVLARLRPERLRRLSRVLSVRGGHVQPGGRRRRCASCPCTVLRLPFRLLACPINTFSGPTSSNCTNCPSTTSSTSNSTFCTCLAGYYSPGTGTTTGSDCLRMPSAFPRWHTCRPPPVAPSPGH